MVGDFMYINEGRNYIMAMNDEHIVLRYRSAKESDRKQRLIELADDNHCSVKTIKDILLANGVDEDELPRGKGRPKTRKPGEISHIPVVEPTEKRLIEPPKPEIKLPEKKAEEAPLVKVEIKEPPLKPIQSIEEGIKNGTISPACIPAFMKSQLGRNNCTEVEEEKEPTPPKLERIPITVLKQEDFDTPSPISQMLAGLNTDGQQLRDAIERKQKLLEATEKAYAALKELETVAKGVQ